MMLKISSLAIQGLEKIILQLGEVTPQIPEKELSEREYIRKVLEDILEPNLLVLYPFEGVHKKVILHLDVIGGFALFEKPDGNVLMIRYNDPQRFEKMSQFFTS